MKCNKSGPVFELVSPCPFPTTITITPRAPPFVSRGYWHYPTSPDHCWSKRNINKNFVLLFGITSAAVILLSCGILIKITPKIMENIFYTIIMNYICYLQVNAHKTEYMCYNQTGNIATLDGASLKLVDKFTYLGSSVSSTEKDIDTRLTKAWTAIDRLSIVWKSDLTDKMKRSFFQAAVVSILLYGCTTWTLTKRLEKKLDGNYTRMLRVVLNKSWRQHPTRHQLYGHLPPITKTIQVRRTRHAGDCWRSSDELISDVLL